MGNLEFLSRLVLGGAALRTQMLAIVGSLVLLSVVVYLIRGGKLKPGYSIVWFAVGISMVVFTVFSPLLSWFAQMLDISYAPAAFLLILVGGLFLLALHFSVLTTRYDRQIRELAQEYGLLNERFKRSRKIS